ncbi:MAG: YggS family pyridoxal phosphate-dependent enzyme [Bacteroidaceae bacterium]|nr:YggS family pyridoxal phosphate-dependent enzyme [Bacteroidaceae bacterium]
MTIQNNIREVLTTLPDGVRLVAVSKFHPVEALQEAYDAGQRIFGESKVQEMTAKHEQLPTDIEWHFIGHLQTNKVKYIAPYVRLIHGVDSYKLLLEINRQGQRAGRIIPCLLQLHVAQEETKFGFSPEECHQMLTEGEWRTLPYVSIRGLMGMASNTDDMAQVRQEFATLGKFFSQVKEEFFSGKSEFCELSMGMSDDYPIAIEEGSTLVRVGSRIFGSRGY